jgi:hypothetical protein
MKKIFTIASLLSFALLFSQNQVAKEIQKLEREKVDFTSFSMLTTNNAIDATSVKDVVDGATLAKINTASLNSIYTNKYDFIEVTVPYNGADVVTKLYKVNPFAEGFHVDTDKAVGVPFEKGVFYRGIVKNDYESVVSLNFFNNEFNGIISSTSLTNLVVGKIDKPNNNSDYIVYADSKMKVMNDFQCAVNDEHNHDQNTNELDGRNVSSTRCITTYLEVDFDIFTANGGNVTTTTNWMTAVFNNVQTLFANDGISTAIKSIFIWTTQDPYTGTSSGDYLFQFNAVRPVFDGDVGQLVGIDPGGLGGVAVGINKLCKVDNFCYSDVNFSYATVPTFSWTVMVLTHEFGHLFGSPHTHACTWNGNNTAIDNCGPVAGGTGEGSNCVTSPPTFPSTTLRGTIMSYCHLSSLGINFNNGFSSQPAGRILNAVNAGNCLSFDCVNTCINLINSIEAINVTNTTATINFAEGGTAAAWQRAVTTFASNFNTWTAIATPTFNVSNLTPNTYYKAKIRPSCPTGVTSLNRDGIFATTANYCSGITITDTGGASGQYTDNETFTRIIAPNIAGQKITLTFTAFNLEADYDYLYIYDGNSTSAPSFQASGYTGATIPNTFTSTAADGSLTMRFVSDPGVVAPGWVATTSCSSLGLNDFSGIDFSYYPNPTDGKVVLTSKTLMSNVTVYNIAGQLLYDKPINDLNSSVDISSFATGTYFFKLRFNDKEVNFKIVKI